MSSMSRRSRPSSAKSPAMSTGHVFVPSSLSSSPSAPHIVGDRPRDGDGEHLSHEIRLLKEQTNAVEKENAFLKTQLQRMIAQLRKKDKQIDQITAMKVSAVMDSAADAIVVGQLRELRSELTAIAKLSDKLRECENSIHTKDEEIRKLKTSLKFTNARELEIEAQTYYNELRRTRKAMVAMQTQLRQQQPVQNGSPSSLYQQSYDQQTFLNMRAEVEQLRAENMRLRSESSQTNKKNSLHLLNSLSKLQQDIQRELKEEEEEAAGAEPWNAHQEEDE